ncbi:MAG: hypothetical protein VW016_12335, partial [Luminiphilus sp.]
MAIWILRPGDQNQYLEGWLAENRIYLPLPDVSGDLRDIDDVQVMGTTLAGMSPASDERAVLAQTKVAWAFLRWVSLGDMVIVASREPEDAIQIGEVESVCQYSDEEGGLSHFREVNWLAVNVARSIVHPEVASVFRAAGDLFQLRREADQAHIKVLNQNNWEPLPTRLRYTGRDEADPNQPVAKETPVGIQQVDAEHLTWDLLAEQAIVEQEPLRARRLLYAIAVSVVMLVVWSSWAEVDIV